MLRYTIIGGAVVATALAGCSSAKDKPTAEAVKSAATSIIANAPKAPADQAPDAVTSPKGKVKITVGGKTLGLTGPVTCNRTVGATYSIGFGDHNSDDHFGFAEVTLDSPPRVVQVGMHVYNVVLIVDKQIGGHATATKNGDSYLIEGAGMSADTSAGTAGEKDFTIDATCPAASDDDGS